MKKTMSSTLKEEDDDLETQVSLASSSLPAVLASPSPVVSSPSEGASFVEANAATALLGSSKTFHGVSAPNSPTDGPSALLARRKSADRVREPRDREERRPASDTPPPGPRRPSSEDSSPPISPRDHRLSVDGGMANLSLNQPPALIIPRRRRDSVDSYAPTSPHPLRNSITHEDLPVEYTPPEIIRPLPKKNSLSGIKESINEGESPTEPLTTVEKLKISGAWIA